MPFNLHLLAPTITIPFRSRRGRLSILYVDGRGRQLQPPAQTNAALDDVTRALDANVREKSGVPGFSRTFVFLTVIRPVWDQL